MSSLVNIIFLSVVCFLYVSAQDCGHFSAPSGYEYDLADLTRPVSAPWSGFEDDNQNENFLYSWNFCVNLQGQPTEATKLKQPSPSIQVDRTLIPYKAVSIGLLAGYELSELEPAGTGIQLVYTNSVDVCAAGNRVLTITATCDENDTAGTISSITEVKGQCKYNFKVKSKAACPTGKKKSKDGLSLGSILLIIFFCGGAVYFAAGTVYNWQVRKVAPGVEALPNYEFWVALPGLVSDGAKFAVLKITGGRVGYSEV